MIYRARHLVSMDGPPVEDAAVAVRGAFVAGAGRWADVRREFAGEPVADLGEVTLLPGFINAHCHLDYSGLRNAILPPANFTEWIGRINALKRELGEADYRAAIARGLGEFARWGCTSLLNVESFPSLLEGMPAPPLRTWWCYEMIDVRREGAAGEYVEEAVTFLRKAQDSSFKLHEKGEDQAEEGGGGEWLGGVGLSPHAPYTASAELYGHAREAARHAGWPWTTHLGESRDEQAMFVRGAGPLFNFLKGIGRPMGDCGRGRSALGTLAAAGAVGPECVVAHLNEWEEEDFALVAPGGPLAGMTVVHCPLSHRYFGHTEFPWEKVQGSSGAAAGVNLCIGTDSPVSGGSFSLLEELRALGEGVAGMGPPERLAAVTLNPARALGLAGELGVVRAGAWADLLALPCGGGAARNIYAEALDCRAPAAWLMVHGRVVLSGSTL